MSARILQAMNHTSISAEQEIRYWMRSPVATIANSATVLDALEAMQKYQVRRLPVVNENGELVGMITQGDIRGAELLRMDGADLDMIVHALCNLYVGQVMHESPIALTPMSSLREAAMLMIENKIGGIPIVDADQLVVGIITESDLFEALVTHIDQVRELPGVKHMRR